MSKNNKFSDNQKNAAFDNAPGECTQWNNNDACTIKKDRHNRSMNLSNYGDRDRGDGWDIHHIDGNTRNNSLENLEAVTYKTHNEINNS